MYLFDLFLDRLADAGLPQLNVPLIANLFEAAGILAGFAFTAGIQLLTLGKSIDVAKIKIVNNAWAFFSGSGFLTGAFLTLGIAMNHETFTNDPVQKNTLFSVVYISLFLILLGLGLVCGGLIYTMKDRGKELEKSDASRKARVKACWHRMSFIVVAVVWGASLSYAVYVFFLPAIWYLK